MNQKDRFNSELLKLKKKLISLHNKKLYNCVMLKIKKGKYEDIEKIFDYDAHVLNLIWFLKHYDKKYILLDKYQKRKEYLYKKRYYEKIKLFRNDLTKDEINCLVNEIKFDDIKIFIDNYIALDNLFKEIDKLIGENIPNWIFSIKLEPGIIPINNLLGFGLFIRNNFIHNNKIEIFKEFYFDPDSISSTILYGYRYYKIGIFELFKNQ